MRKEYVVFSPTHESWFALQVAPRHEKKVSAMLEYKGHEAFLPTYQIRRRWSDRVKTLDQPMFPGYVFCRLQKTGSGLVLATPGVIRVVSFGGKPSPIPNEEIAGLQRISQSGAEVTPFPYAQVGHKVRIIHGPFAGLVGVVTQVRNQHRLVVAVDTILKAISIAIDSQDVAAVSEPVTFAA
jgi:transcription antitermination factor NusG